MYHKHQKRDLVLNTMSDWQPVQLLQHRTDMITDNTLVYDVLYCILAVFCNVGWAFSV